jgi:molybdopterin converting factor small subunit
VGGVKVLLFGAAADRAGTRQTELSVSEGTTLGDMWPALVNRHPSLAPMRDTLAFAVNGENKVSPGDEVAVLPPVSGG